MRVPLRGVTGRVVVGPDVAAELGAWSVAVADDRFLDGSWTCMATVRSRDAFLLAHGARFGLRLDMGAARFCWDDVRVEDGAQMVITGAGAPEVRP